MLARILARDFALLLAAALTSSASLLIYKRALSIIHHPYRDLNAFTRFTQEASGAGLLSQIEWDRLLIKCAYQATWPEATEILIRSASVSQHALVIGSDPKAYHVLGMKFMDTAFQADDHMLQTTVFIDYQDRLGVNLVLYFAKLKMFEAVRRLVNAGADIFLEDFSGLSAFLLLRDSGTSPQNNQNTDPSVKNLISNKHKFAKVYRKRERSSLGIQLFKEVSHRRNPCGKFLCPIERCSVTVDTHRSMEKHLLRHLSENPISVQSYILKCKRRNKSSVAAEQNHHTCLSNVKKSDTQIPSHEIKFLERKFCFNALNVTTSHQTSQTRLYAEANAIPSYDMDVPRTSSDYTSQPMNARLFPSQPNQIQLNPATNPQRAYFPLPQQVDSRPSSIFQGRTRFK